MATLTTTHAAQTEAAPLIITADEELLDRALASAAATGVDPLVVCEAGSARRHWTRASVVLVGVDRARALAEELLPPRARVLLIGTEQDQPELCRWSMTLGAAVVVLPTQLTWLASAMAEGVSAGAAGIALAVLGGSGGVGASTLAAGAAWRAAQQGRQVLLVDADPYGGGLDLLVGAEQAMGWRWPQLSSASGHLGDLTAHLPGVDGLSVLAMAREDPGQPTAEALGAVVRTARQTHDLVVVDLGRAVATLLHAGLRAVDATAILVGDDVRAIAAGRGLVHELGPTMIRPGLVARRGIGLGVPPEVIASTVGLELIGELGHDRHLRAATLQGDPPGRSVGRRWSRQCDAVLSAITSGVRDDA